MARQMRNSSEMSWIAAAAVLALAACTPRGSGDGGPDADRPDGAGGADADRGPSDAADRAEVDAELGPVAAPLTYVAREIRATDERLCDLDGDGLADNTLANLGASGALTLAAFNTLIDAEMDTTRMLAHVPRVADIVGLEDREVVVIFFDGLDADSPPNPEDDLLGGEAFFVQPWSVDACGEPLHYAEHVPLRAGEFEGGAEEFLVTFSETEMVLRQVRVSGQLGPLGGSAEVAICAAALIRDLGAETGLMGTTSASLLETFLNGGNAFGVPGVPGLSPDLDIDRDGLERFVLDGDGSIESCIDGDGTVIPGRMCWLEEGMADGFSFVWRFDMVDAELEGLARGWESYFVTQGLSCEAEPVVSLWDQR